MKINKTLIKAGIFFLVVAVISLHLTEIIFSEFAVKSTFSIFIFYIITSLIIIPAPLDLLYYNFLHDNIPYVYFATFFGLLIGQSINYFLGKYLSSLFEPYIKKNQEWMKKHLYKYEKYAIFIFNLTPLPYSELNLLVGITKFRYKKWLSLVAVAFAFKLLIINALALYF